MENIPNLLKNSYLEFFKKFWLLMQLTQRYEFSLDREDPLEKEMATHSSNLAWKIPWTEELGGLRSMQSQRVGRD